MATKQATQAETARDVVMHIARIQLASITAASKFFAGWAVSDGVSPNLLCLNRSGECVARRRADKPAAAEASPTQICDLTGIERSASAESHQPSLPLRAAHYSWSGVSAVCLREPRPDHA